MKTSQYKRTHTCGQLREKDQDSQVDLCGWVYRWRNHGQLVFVDLRDRYGVTQIVFDPRIDAKAHELSQALRAEWVIHIQGNVRVREKNLINPKLATGAIEVEVTHLNVLSMASTPPFELQDDELHPNEELRLTYRYLDMRQAPVYKKLEMRHKICQHVRNYFNDQQFLEIHTPYLAKSTPEGARDYLVPSRVYPGKFFALPQSPQIFKQLLMVGGMDRYYQICPCFRDEDLRADRQPEFYQIDVEMSFAHPEDLFKIVENCFSSLFSDLLQKPLQTPFRRMSHHEAMESYGSDKPDLRFDMKLIRLDDLLKESTFDLAKQELELGAISKAICVKGGASKLSRKVVDSLISFVQSLGLSGLAWMKRSSASAEEGPGLTGPLVKFFEGPLLEKLFERMDMQEDDLLLVGFDREKTLNQAMDHLRRHVAKLMGLIDKSRFEFVWIVDFPLFQYDPVNRCLAAEHHPFCSPLPSDLEKLETDPLAVRANCYDLVLNGYELASGSQRIHDFALQKRIFELLKLTQEDIDERFGFFVRALQYGTPPHLGCALGLDRIVMILTETDNIRDVIAFPKTQNAADLMCESPSAVEVKQLQELKLAIKP